MTNAAPQGNPGDIINWPMLKIVYRTDADALARLLPPGIEPGDDPRVFLTFYSFPVLSEPELGLVMTAAANFAGIQGEYALVMPSTRKRPSMSAANTGGSRSTWPISATSA